MLIFDSRSFMIYLIEVLIVTMFMVRVAPQPDFNYVADWNFTRTVCPLGSLSTGYTCSATLAFEWTCGFYMSCEPLYIQSATNFQTTMTGSIVAPLDYKSGGLYYKRGFTAQMAPIYNGSYKLSFAAMTRKTGTPSDYNFTVSLFGHSYNAVYISNKTYTFSSLGTVNFTETVLVQDVNLNAMYLQFNAGSSPLTSFASPIGAGITNVRFQKTACAVNQSLVTLVNNEKACIQKHVIASVNQCSKWTYFWWQSRGGGWADLGRVFTCVQCITPYKLVNLYDTSHIQQLEYFYKRFGCTINEIPQTVWYTKTSITDSQGNFYYTTYACNVSSVNFLVVPGIGYPTIDTGHNACGFNTDPTVLWWEVVNGTYVPAKCTTTGHYPVIQSTISRVCQQIVIQIPNCLVYNLDLSCYTCLADTFLATVNASGVLSKICIATSSKIYNCLTYLIGTLDCNQCDTNYTLFTVNSVMLCIRNDLLDGNCSTYTLNSANNYECSECLNGYSIQLTYTVNGQIKRCLSSSQIEVSSQPDFNYIADWNFSTTNCPTESLTAGYICSTTSWVQWSCPLGMSCDPVFIQSAANFQTSMTGLIVSPLDYKSGGLYYRRGFTAQMAPIYNGTYKLSFTAMTRKTGIPSDYTFTISLFGHNYDPFYIYDKRYNFSSLGTMNITETVVVENVQLQYMYFQITALKNSTPSFASPIGAGITNVRFQKTACSVNQSLVTLINNQKACIQNLVIASVNQCKKWTYFWWQSRGGSWADLKHVFSCIQCSYSYKLVTLYDISHYQQHENFYKRFGCTINEIPSVSWYTKTSITDSQGNFYYTTISCNGSPVNYLVVPGIGFPEIDAIHNACGITPDPLVLWWQVVNSTYVPARCAINEFYPVIQSPTIRLCQQVTTLIPNCLVYNSDFTCHTCLADTFLATLNFSSILGEGCIPTSSKIQNCLTYILGTLACNSCDTNYTLSTVNSVSVCIRNDLLDGSCQTYTLNTANNYECTICANGYSIQLTYTANGQIKRCLSSSQIIRDCTQYEIITGGYGCHTCSNAANIGRYSFIYNSLQANRCLNTVTERLDQCSTYSYANSVYTCISCYSGFQLNSISISSVITLKCLATLTQVISNCAMYTYASNIYVCTSCDSQFTLKTVSVVDQCLPDSVIDAQCTAYIFNGSNYECSQCQSTYEVKSLYTQSGTYKHCLLSTDSIRDCELYESITSGYQCRQCQNTANIARYSFILDSVSAFRCLDSQTQYRAHCTSYSLDNGLYSCVTCATGYQLKKVDVSNAIEERCLNSATEVISHCEVYTFDGTSYLCQECDQETAIQTIEGVDMCLLSDSVDDECVTYSLSGQVYKCSECSSNFVLKDAYFSSGTFPRCLVPSDLIRDCLIHELYVSGYDCHECDPSSSTFKEIITVDSVISFRCLNNATEYVEYCTSYTYLASKYKCLECLSRTLAPVNASNIETLACVPSYQVVEDCSHYKLLQQDYVCDACDAGFTLKAGYNGGICVHDQGLDQNCVVFRDQGQWQDCEQCDSLTELQTVAVGGDELKKCLLLADVVNGCLVYAQVGGKYQCQECDSFFELFSVTIDSQIIPRCLAPDELIENCLEYKYTNAIYTCTACESQMTLVEGATYLDPSANTTLCIDPAQLIDHCLSYVKYPQFSECTKCSSNHTLVSVLLQSSIFSSQCLPDTLAIRYCQTYNENSPGVLECTQCKQGATLCNVLIGQETKSRCLANSSDIVQHCLMYQGIVVGPYVCKQCDYGFVLKDGRDKKVCVDPNNLLENCVKYVYDGTLEYCIKCAPGFTLTSLQQNGNLVKKCFSIYTEALEGCKVHSYSADNDLQCDECDSLHTLSTIRLTTSKTLTLCLSNSQVITHCLTYAEISPVSCGYDCLTCDAGFTLATVKIGTRITKGCLDSLTEYLPFCELHFVSSGVYYCKHGICETGAFAVQIGTLPSQLACTHEDLITAVNAQNCQQYERPHLADLELKCLVCKDTFVEPYCQMTDDEYQGLTTGP